MPRHKQPGIDSAPGKYLYGFTTAPFPSTPMLGGNCITMLHVVRLISYDVSEEVMVLCDVGDRRIFQFIPRTQIYRTRRKVIFKHSTLMRRLPITLHKGIPHEL